MRRANRILASVGIAAMSMSLLPLAAGAAERGNSTLPPGEVISEVQADVDGDARPDRVRLHALSDEDMLLRVALRGGYVSTEVEGKARGQALRSVDVNGDGTHEVMVPKSVGANTTTYTVWRLADDGLEKLETESGDTWEIARGGGATAVSTFGCPTVVPERALVTVNAVEVPDGDSFAFKGSRTTYRVSDGVAHVVTDEPVYAHDRNDPQLQADPMSCEPRS